MSVRENVLNAAIDAVTRSRKEAYGELEDNFELIARMWSAYLNVEIKAGDVPQMMIMLKAARAKTGYNMDNFVDQAGYAACAAEIAARERGANA